MQDQREVDIEILRKRKTMEEEFQRDFNFTPLPQLEAFINEIINELEKFKND
jgi:hypothetical protein